MLKLSGKPICLEWNYSMLQHHRYSRTYTVDGGSKHPWKVDYYLPDYKVSHSQKTAILVPVFAQICGMVRTGISWLNTGYIEETLVFTVIKSDFIKGWKFLDQLSGYQFLRKCSVSWRCFTAQRFLSCYVVWTSVTHTPSGRVNLNVLKGTQSRC